MIVAIRWVKRLSKWPILGSLRRELMLRYLHIIVNCERQEK